MWMGLERTRMRGWGNNRTRRNMLRLLDDRMGCQPNMWVGETGECKESM